MLCPCEDLFGGSQDDGLCFFAGLWFLSRYGKKAAREDRFRSLSHWLVGIVSCLVPCPLCEDMILVTIGGKDGPFFLFKKIF